MTVASQRWVPILAFDVAWIDQTYHVVKRGGLHVKDWVPDDEITWQPIGTAVDYAEAFRIVRALRTTLTAQPDNG